MEPRDILTRPAAPPDAVLRYGPGPDHVADLRLPAVPRPGGPGPGGSRPGGTADATGEPADLKGEAADGWGEPADLMGQAADPRLAAPLVIFLHGGFWRAAYDRAHTGPLAVALAADGFAVCTPEYRRTGRPGGGWPGTFDDVAAAVDALPLLAAKAAGRRIDPDRPLLAGHSAGGHLALWAASRHRLPAGVPWAVPASRFRGVVALAAVSDLVAGHRQGLGNGAVAALMGGGPDDQARRFDLANPAGLVPVGTPVRLVHGRDDDTVPCEMSLDYAFRARAAGDDVTCTALAGVEHFGLIDPMSVAWAEVAGAFRAFRGPRSSDPETT